jgi:hypothetical protein
VAATEAANGGRLSGLSALLDRAEQHATAAFDRTDVLLAMITLPIRR